MDSTCCQLTSSPQCRQEHRQWSWDAWTINAGNNSDRLMEWLQVWRLGTCMYGLWTFPSLLKLDVHEALSDRCMQRCWLAQSSSRPSPPVSHPLVVSCRYAAAWSNSNAAMREQMKSSALGIWLSRPCTCARGGKVGVPPHRRRRRETPRAGRRVRLPPSAGTQLVAPIHRQAVDAGGQAGKNLRPGAGRRMHACMPVCSRTQEQAACMHMQGVTAMNPWPSMSCVSATGRIDDDDDDAWTAGPCMHGQMAGSASLARSLSCGCGCNVHAHKQLAH